jgi:hypothetical protein
MPSWVVPSVAAELWGVSVEHVLAEVTAGRLPARREGELLFVDVDPSAAEAQQAEQRPAPYRRPLAWTLGTSEHSQPPLVTAAERNALLAPDDVPSAGPVEIDAPFSEPSFDNAPAPIKLTDDDKPDWEAVRARVSRTRVPPRQASLAA